MKKELEGRSDIYVFVKEFYTKLLQDEIVNHFFEDFKNEDKLEIHLQVLVDFWDNILFYSGTYQKNAMQPHLLLHQKKEFKEIHFTHWLLHFNTTIDSLFIGEMAHTAKSRALSIATVMQIKVNEQNKK
ncbi:group III truncated hemoglobin [Lutibacter sp.]|uniref:group III truncated hemoglobin n=1 Tax=Lutibacter sp. TaxID=1925666 RepID=UPI002737635D|nr:group III truncated hemoglobin [Lutibacter sp.]MDP3312441.1 group III truncated hemoglobin [Lutibacter sp.]